MNNFINDKRFSIFLNKLIDVSIKQTSPSYIDTSPDDVFDGPIGTILTKNGSDILYKLPTTNDFVSLTKTLPGEVYPIKYALEHGINYNAMWIKQTPYNSKKWKFIAYKSIAIDACGCCDVNQSTNQNPPDTIPSTVMWGRYGPSDVNPALWIIPDFVILSPLAGSDTLTSIERVGGYPFTTELHSTLTEDVYPLTEIIRSVNWTHDQTLPQFNEISGRLEEVKISLQNLLRSTPRAENLDAAPATITLGSTATIDIIDTSLNTLLTVTSTVTQNNSVSAFDGIIDYAGASGYVIDPPLSTSNTDTITLTTIDSTFSQFTGLADVTLTFVTSGSKIATGSPDISSNVLTETGAALDVTYRYHKNEGYFWLAVPDSTNWAPRAVDGVKLLSTNDIFPMASASDLGVATEINGYGYALVEDSGAVLNKMFRSKYPIMSGDDDSILIYT